MFCQPCYVNHVLPTMFCQPCPGTVAAVGRPTVGRLLCDRRIGRSPMDAGWTLAGR